MTTTSRLVLALLTQIAGASALAAQARPAQTVPAGAVSGTVVAAGSGQPVPNAVVVLESASDASVVSTGAGPFVSRSLLAVTDESGAYRFGALPAGEYRLVVRHLGFHQAVVSVDLAQAAPFRVSVGLVVNPIQLDALDANAPTAEPYGRLRTVSDERRFGDLAAEQYRDAKFLEGDAAVITHSDVVESVTLGETDLFRAVQRLPGVSTRDDYTAALWTRGAPWSQTRVYFDGQPLFNPVHAVGVFAGVNTDAVGAASFHPGVRSSSIGEGAAGVLNIGSRRPVAAGFGMLGELSMISAHGAADWSSRGGKVSGMFAARRSYVDVATRLAESMGADSGTYIPYAFYDLTGRFDADLGRGFGVEASGLWEQDDVHGDVNDLLRATQGHWGNRLGRVSLTSPLAGLRARTTLGISDFIGDMARTQSPLTSGTADTTAEHAPMHNNLSVINLGTEVGPVDASTRPTWSMGVQASLYRQNYVGQYPRPYPVVVLTDSLVMHEELPVVALWGERRFALGRHMAFEAGLRVEAHRPVMNAPSVGFAPKLTFRATPPGTRITFTAAAARSYQYTQALAPAGPSVGPDLYVTDVWFLAGDTIPAIRSDIITTGIEAWLGLGWTASLNLYARRVHGMAVPEPAPGALVIAGQTINRAIFVPAENLAQGVELSARRLVGAWTMSAAYSFGRSDLKAHSANPNVTQSFIYPSSADRRHVVDLTGMMRLGGSWRAGGAFTAASGAPYSRFLLGDASTCDTLTACSDSVATLIESPNNGRTGWYASFDLLLDWSRTMRSGLSIGAYFQLRNVFNSANAVTYTGSIGQCSAPHPPTLIPVPGRFQVCDRFDKGVPILPLAGIRVAF